MKLVCRLVKCAGYLLAFFMGKQVLVTCGKVFQATFSLSLTLSFPESTNIVFVIISFTVLSQTCLFWYSNIRIFHKLCSSYNCTNRIIGRDLHFNVNGM